VRRAAECSKRQASNDLIELIESHKGGSSRQMSSKRET
jgi:hypothetical protein